MPLNHSDATHSALLTRVPVATGRDVKAWLQMVEAGPAFSRPEERAHWIQDEYSLSTGMAKALAHEYDLVRARRSS